MKPETMTLDECRDWVALQSQNYRVTRGGAKGPRDEPVDLLEEKLNEVDWFVVQGEEGWPEHPIKPTLDAAAAAMPEGWEYEIHNRNVGGVVSCRAIGPLGHWDKASKASGDTELLARWRLVVACMMAEKESPNE